MTPEHLRLCDFCNVIQDEKHHLVSCLRHASLRETLFAKANDLIPNFNQLSSDGKFTSLLMSDNLDMLYAIGKYLIEADCLQ